MGMMRAERLKLVLVSPASLISVGDMNGTFT